MDEKVYCRLTNVDFSRKYIQNNAVVFKETYPLLITMRNRASIRLQQKARSHRGHIASYVDSCRPVFCREEEVTCTVRPIDLGRVGLGKPNATSLSLTNYTKNWSLISSIPPPPVFLSNALVLPSCFPPPHAWLRRWHLPASIGVVKPLAIIRFSVVSAVTDSEHFAADL